MIRDLIMAGGGDSAPPVLKDQYVAALEADFGMPYVLKWDGSNLTTNSNGPSLNSAAWMVASADGSVILLATTTGTIKALLWNPITGLTDPGFTLTGISQFVLKSLSISPDGAYIVYANSEGTVSCHAFSKTTGFGAVINTVTVTSIAQTAFHPDGNAILITKTASAYTRAVAFNGSAGFGTFYTNPAGMGAQTCGPCKFARGKFGGASDVVVAFVTENTSSAGVNKVYASVFDITTGFGTVQATSTTVAGMRLPNTLDVDAGSVYLGTNTDGFSIPYTVAGGFGTPVTNTENFYSLSASGDSTVAFGVKNTNAVFVQNAPSLTNKTSADLGGAGLNSAVTCSFMA